MNTRYFRAGVGTVIYTQASEIVIFKRAKLPANIWQFQQGGIDKGEAPEATLWRELEEEVGLTENDIEEVTEVPGWHAYQDFHTDTDNSIERIGQVHRWFFLKLKPDATIDLAKATDNEFNEWRFTSFEEAINLTSDRKKHVYETLWHYFQTHILK